MVSTSAYPSSHVLSLREDGRSKKDVTMHYLRKLSFLFAVVLALAGGGLAALPASAAESGVTNLAPHGTASASGQEVAGQWGPELTIDGNTGGDVTFRDQGANFRDPVASRWSANSADRVWLAVDLGAPADISHVTVTWGKQYATNYAIEASTDGNTWTPVAVNLAGAASSAIDTDTTTAGLPTTARYWRVSTSARNSQWPIGIWEFEIFGVFTDNPGNTSEESGTALPALIPQPVTYEATDGEPFTLEKDAAILATGAGVAEAERFATGLRAATGFALPVAQSSADAVADIRFVLDAGGPAGEAYTLDADSGGVSVMASTAHGLFNGAQTLRQLFGPWASYESVTNGPWTFPAVHITDQPRFGYRSMMLDPSRSFLTVEEVKEAVDAYSRFKLNYLHLHLADDQGWRIEITNDGRAEGDTIDYTRLTSVSGQTAIGATRFNTDAGVPGYYTQDDLREIVAYAQARHVTVVPEIDMPGHTEAALHAIPQLNTPGSSHNGTVNSSGQTITDSARYLTADANTTADVGYSYLDPNSEATWTFINHVVDQVSAITKAPYFHFGGDESQEMTKTAAGKASYEAFVTKAATLIREKGLTPIGWNEAAAGTQQPGDVLQAWSAGVGNAVSSEGAQVIYSLAGNTYFPQRPGTDVAGPNWACGSAGYCGINAFYNYDPASVAGSDAATLGVEGAMWNEHMRSIQDIFFLEFPRAAATAEVAWSPEAVRAGKVAQFRDRLTNILPALTASGVDFYQGDAVTTNPQVAGVDTRVAEAGASVTLGYGYSPATTLEQVSAAISWVKAGSEVATDDAVDATVERPYLPGTTSTHNDRQQNGLFTLSAAAPNAPGTYLGTLSLTVGGNTVKDTVTVTVKAEEPGGPEETDSSTCTPSGSDVPSGSSTPGSGGSTSAGPGVSASATTPGGSVPGGSASAAPSETGTSSTGPTGTGPTTPVPPATTGLLAHTGMNTAVMVLAALGLLGTGLILRARRDA
ncbi:family 20 glycosylhydrolase [Neoactinobaculum massilliense]|uniref:family 20 glycosylhydrolase n=1 Tax=Neoactinobaculum massilliense TaxID=2364794 RepID=UPI000F545E2D|nr:family 20 glycosylhydrolase [Neoactinobaculum massilliense]